MNEVRGRVLLGQTDRGVPNLVVAAYDVDTANDRVDVRLSAAVVPKLDRLGSSTTDVDGRFTIEYEDDAFGTPAEQRPDLAVVVATAEADGAAERILHVSPTPRANAGRREEYVVRLSESVLGDAGIDVDALGETPGGTAEHLTQLAERRRVIRGAVQRAKSDLVDVQRERRARFSAGIRGDLRTRLSRLSIAARAEASYVSDGESVTEKNLERIKAGLSRFGTVRTPGPTRHGIITLTAAQKAALDAVRDSDGSVSAGDLHRIVATSDGAEPYSASVVRDDPLEEICRPRSRERTCGESALEIPAGPLEDPTDDDGAGQPADSPLDEVGILEHAARLLRDTRSPEQAVAFGLDHAADSAGMENEWASAQGGVRSRVAALNVEPGPADTTTYYDFHNVHIAFEHVWQEAIDQGVLDVAEDLYDQIVELGGNADIDTVDELRGEARVTVQSRNNLASESSTAACDLRDHRGGGFWDDLLGWMGLGKGTAQGGCSTPPPRRPGSADGNVRDHREQIPELLAELGRRLRTAYPFTVFAANDKERSVNFGLVVTYRQKWEPVGYQPGELVKTLTLTPGEVRRYSSTRKTSKSRSVKEAEKNSSSRRVEESDTQRAEAEIVRKTLRKSNFSLTAEGALGGLLGDLSTTSSMEAQRESQSTKKRFREAVRKSAQEYKDERSLEVSTQESFSSEVTESGEIKNSNEEIPVTYLFFELQRRFRVTERIHRVTPVVFVAQEVPAPDEIDSAWLLAHDWILQRVLLDDSHSAALTYATTTLPGQALAVAQLSENLERQRALVDDLKGEMLSLKREMLGWSREFWGELALSINERSLEAAQQHAVRRASELSAQLEREVGTVQEMTEAYNDAVRSHTEGRIQVARLALHIKQNILHYMQAIWSYEPPDQRYFRLHRVEIPTLEADQRYTVADTPDAMAFGAPPHRGLPDGLGNERAAFRFTTRIALNEEFSSAPLSKVADLDDLLGFKGNYMMFPLARGNALTEFMAAPYVDKGFNTVVDPDEPGNWTLDEFAAYVCCLKKQLSSVDFQALRPDLRRQYEVLLGTPHRNGELVTVPTGSLYIEALAGVRPVMESFKLMHRAVDVKKVQAEVRAAELDNVRRAARILAKQYADPDIEKTVLVQGAGVDVDV